MAKRALPNLGLIGNYGIGDDDWGDDQNANLLKLSTLVQGGVLGRVAAVPANPAQGDIYVLTAAPNANNVASFDGAAWVYFPPNEGWLLYDRGTDEYISYDGAAWAVLETGGGGGAAYPPFEGNAGKVLAVNEDEDGVEWVTGGGGGGGASAVIGDEAGFNYPDLTGFTWANQRGATVTADKLGTKIVAPFADGGTYSNLTTALPAGDFDLYMRVATQANQTVDYPTFALAVKSGTRILSLGFTPGNRVCYLQDTNDAGGNNGNRFNRPYERRAEWYRLQRVGDILSGYVSSTGLEWSKVGQFNVAGLVFDRYGVSYIPSSNPDNLYRVLHLSTTPPTVQEISGGGGGAVTALKSARVGSTADKALGGGAEQPYLQGASVKHDDGGWFDAANGWFVVPEGVQYVVFSATVGIVNANGGLRLYKNNELVAIQGDQGGENYKTASAVVKVAAGDLLKPICYAAGNLVAIANLCHASVVGLPSAIGGGGAGPTSGGDLVAGWRLDSDGWLEQWGRIVPGGGNQDINFPVPFKQGVASITGACIEGTDNINTLFAINFSAITLTKFRAHPRFATNGNVNNPGEAFNWFARGR